MNPSKNIFLVLCWLLIFLASSVSAQSWSDYSQEPGIRLGIGGSLQASTRGASSFAIQSDGQVRIDDMDFASLQEYYQSNYFRDSGKRCGTRWMSQPQSLWGKIFKSPDDCTKTSTTINEDYVSETVLNIPVVVHIIHKNDGTGDLDNDRIRRQIQVLNEDYAAMKGTIGENGFNTKIQFKLMDITRTANDNWHDDNDEVEYKTNLGWDQRRYCNIYVNSASGYLGYAYYAQDSSAVGVLDGIVMLYEAFGGRDEGSAPYNQGRTLVHEMGHYLGLQHTFEGNACNNTYQTGDRIVDTPAEENEHYECTQTDTCGTPDPIYNYMNYTPDSCMNQFTEEQANRMVCSLLNYRPELVTAASRFTVSVSENPTGSGTVTGADEVDEGAEHTVSATANSGYRFVNWTEDGVQVANTANYTFIVEDDRTLVANFAEESGASYSIAVSANPAAGGTVAGEGTYNHGDSVTVNATANAGYDFVNWTEGSLPTRSLNHGHAGRATATLSPFPKETTPLTESKPLRWSDIPQKAMTADGGARVILRMDVPNLDALTRASVSSRPTVAPLATGDTSGAMADSDKALRDGIAAAASSLLSTLPRSAYRLNRTYDHLPFLALDIQPDAFLNLRADPRVLAIYPDIPTPLPKYGLHQGPKSPSSNGTDSAKTTPSLPTMDDTIELIGADKVWDKGYTGNGWHVAILDTGIRKSHHFFADKTIVEACFSASRHCPNGQSSMTGAGAAAHYPATYAGFDHGTHVAGTAAGQKSDGTLFGVAKDADIIAVNVFSKFTADECGGSPCVMSYDSDQVAALDYLYGLRATYNIGAGNMSLGGGRYSAYCDNSPQKDAIDLLHGANIPTAIATGNDGYCGEIGSPACISTAIAVMATTKSDDEASFNNWHPTIGDIFAPGVSILSATGDSDTSYERWDGTSMATPHVAGALTLMRQHGPSDDPDAQLSKLMGPDIISACEGGGIKPRLYMDISEETYTVSVSANPAAGGTVTGGGSFEAGDSVTVTASANTGYQFVNWTEEGTIVSSSTSYTFTAGGNRNLTANFSQVVSTDASYTFTANSSRTLVANFAAQGEETYTISVSASPGAGGTVSGGGTYNQDDSVTVNATANSGYDFVNWTEDGVEASTNPSYSFTVTGDRTLVANFAAQGEETYTISVSASPGSGGTVSGGGTYNQDDSVTVNALANAGYDFVNWTVDGIEVADTVSYTFTVTGDRTLVANFTTVSSDTFTITVVASPSDESGNSVSGGGDYTHGQIATVRAIPDTLMGWKFVNWTEAGHPGPTSREYSFPVTGNRILTANFSQVEAIPTLSEWGMIALSFLMLFAAAIMHCRRRASRL